LAVARAQLSPEAAWNAAHVDEDWQISQWGEDEEAKLRRQSRKRDFDAAAKLLELY
jgi:chaperone required for assembly of F1-ATPase